MSLKRLPLIMTSLIWLSLIPLAELSSQAPANADQPPNVDREELRGPAVNFINRTNAPAGADRRQQDVAAGQGLADSVVGGGEATGAGVTIRRVFDREKPGLGADILEISPNADFGHINRVQRVLTGYLMKAFEYQQGDAEVLARFILYYNARNRNNLNVVKERYSETVQGAVDQAKLGIDRNWRNWAGRTQILLPLRKSAVRPGGADLNNPEIDKGTQNVNPQEKQEFNKVTEERKKEEQQKLEDTSKQLEDQRKKIEEEKTAVDQQQQDVQRQREDTGRRIQELNRDPVRNADEIKREEAKQEELKKQEEQVAQKQEEIKKQEEQVAQKQEEVKQQQEEVAGGGGGETKPGETAANNTDVAAADQNQKPAEQKTEEKKEEVAENVVGEKILFMRVLRFSSDRGHYMNELWYIDTAKDDTLYRSPYTNICSREFVVLPNNAGILVAGYKGESGDHTGHNLALLSQEDLTLKKISDETVFWNTPMIIQDGKLYVIEEYQGQFYLARFGLDLTFEARSSEGVSPYSVITVFRDKIYVTGKTQNGDATNIKVFGRTDLRLQKTIDPRSTQSADVQ